MGLEKDFYEELDSVSTNNLIPDRYIIYERDSKKGRRVIHYALNSDSIYREETWKEE